MGVTNKTNCTQTHEYLTIDAKEWAEWKVGFDLYCILSDLEKIKCVFSKWFDTSSCSSLICIVA